MGHIGLLSIAVVTAMAYFARKMVKERRFHKDKPGPPHHWFWGHLKLMAEIMAQLPPGAHIQAAVQTMVDKYDLPGLWYLDLWPVVCGQVIITDPDVALHITVTRNHPKHEAEKWAVDPLIGSENIVTSEGHLWKYLHKMLSPAFAVQHISNMRPAIAEEIMEFRSILHRMAESGEHFRLEELTLRTTFDVIGKATFGHSMNAKSNGSETLEHWETMTRAFAKTRESWNPVHNFFSKRIVQRETRKLDAILTELILKRFDAIVQEKKDLSNKKDLAIMDLILRDYIGEMRQLSKQGLDPDFLKTAITQVKTVFVGGSSTVSDTMCFTAMILSTHPEVVQKLREEHDAVFTRGIDATYEMLQNDPYRLNQLEYTTNVIKEVLRVYPVGPTARGPHATEKFLAFEGQRYPVEGKMILPVQFAMHMNDKFFPNPRKFDPDRYDREDFPRHAWRPFERGPRACLGQPLAMDELKIMLLLTIRELDFICADLKPNKTPRVPWTDWDLTFGDRAFQMFVFEARPRDGMPMFVKKSDWAS